MLANLTLMLSLISKDFARLRTANIWKKIQNVFGILERAYPTFENRMAKKNYYEFKR